MFHKKIYIFILSIFILLSCNQNNEDNKNSKTVTNHNENSIFEDYRINIYEQKELLSIFNYICSVEKLNRWDASKFDVWMYCSKEITNFIVNYRGIKDYSNSSYFKFTNQNNMTAKFYFIMGMQLSNIFITSDIPISNSQLKLFLFDVKENHNNSPNQIYEGDFYKVQDISINNENNFNLNVEKRIKITNGNRVIKGIYFAILEISQKTILDIGYRSIINPGSIKDPSIYKYLEFMGDN